MKICHHVEHKKTKSATSIVSSNCHAFVKSKRAIVYGSKNSNEQSKEAKKTAMGVKYF